MITKLTNRRLNLIRLRGLNQQLCDAVRALCHAVQQELPVGTVIEATLGRSRIRGEVVGHAEGWSATYAGSVDVRNVKSGKIRRVTPHDPCHEVTVISFPEDREVE